MSTSGARGSAEILQTIRDLGRLEGAMAGYYTACSEMWAELSTLWMELALEEERHEKILSDVEAMVRSHPDQFRFGRKAEASAITSFVDNVNETASDVMKGRMTLGEALTFALRMEESIIEGRFFEIVVTASQRYLRFMEMMSADLDRHREKVALALRRLKADPA